MVSVALTGRVGGSGTASVAGADSGDFGAGAEEARRDVSQRVLCAMCVLDFFPLLSLPFCSLVHH